MISINLTIKLHLNDFIELAFNDNKIGMKSQDISTKNISIYRQNRNKIFRL